MTDSRLPQDLPTGLLINGEWASAADGETVAVIDPATGDELTSIADAAPADATAALDAASAAGPAWAATPPRQRAEILRRAFDEVTRRKDEFARLMTLEMGKPLAEAYGEVTYGSEFLRWFSEEAVRIGGRYGLNPEGSGRMVVSQRPVGPAYLITPWNFPLAMATRKIAPALAAGCPVIIKPAANTPLTTLLFAQLLVEVGVPAGVVNVIASSRPSEITEPLLADRRLRKLSFTGSTQVGRTLLAQAAQNVLRTSMELGGNAPFLVFDDADLDAAVDGAMTAKFRNIGQACTAANRFIVHASLAEEFTARVTERVQQMKVGSGLTDGVTIGPLIDAKAVDSTDAMVADALDLGARVTTGGERIEGRGYFYAPTVLRDVQPGSRLLREEIFGPVLGVTTFETDAEAVAAANDTEYGLVSYAYTRDLARAHRLIDELETGMTGLNTGLVSNAAAPFGGVKASGLGREGAQEGIAEYLETKYTLIPAT
ncbi:MAG TPA: NAD-dependent succinate-semialdehyde dehydrogenase [Microlunatus sp.]|nr:NAD-dependent succinate-semialdehyde dehydrogenase [Microlunatus sp.]